MRNRALSIITTIAACASLAGCEGLIGADFNHPSESSDAGGSAAGDAGDLPGSGHGEGGAHPDGGGITQPTTDAGPGAGTYAAAQVMLEQKRFPGPLTAQGSRGMCTDTRFVWRDSDGTLHAWTASTQIRTDYAFKAPQGPSFFPGDAFISVPKSDYSVLEVYDPSAQNVLVGSTPYKYSSAGTTDGVVLGMQTGGGTKVQHWTPGTGTIDDVSAILATSQPPSSFGNDELVIPASVTIPYPLYIVNVVKKTTTSVTFDGSIGMYETMSTPLGLVASYARSGPSPNIRLYQGNSDTSRVEIGDQLANMPGLYADSPATEHKFLAHITHDGNSLIYASAFGIFAYQMEHGTLSALALGPNQKVYVPDVLCVIPSAHLLMFRIQSDAVGQVWALPLTGLL